MYRIGIDLGGTNIKIGLVDENYQLISQSISETKVYLGVNAVIQKLVDSVQDMIEKNGMDESMVSGVGIGCPGVIDSGNGRVLYSNNFNWNDLPLQEILQERLRLPVAIMNDAQCAALGELTAGGAVGCRNMILLTLGTGVGSGIVVNGEILEGSGGGGIAGHMVIVQDGRPCTCGRRGCLEAYASATALIAQTKKQLALHPDSLIAGQCGGNPENIDGRAAFEAAKQGDCYAAEIVEQYIDALANGIANLIDLFRPEKVLLSGGICHEGDSLLLPLNRKMKENCFANAHLVPPQAEVAKLKNTAGIIGASSLILIRGVC